MIRRHRLDLTSGILIATATPFFSVPLSLWLFDTYPALIHVPFLQLLTMFGPAGLVFYFAYMDQKKRRPQIERSNVAATPYDSQCPDS